MMQALERAAAVFCTACIFGVKFDIIDKSRSA